jgi:hypothetical protein
VTDCIELTWLHLADGSIWVGMGVYPARFLFLVGFLVIDLGLGAAASVGLVAVEAEAAMVPRCFDGRHDDRCGLGNRKCRFQEGGKRDMLSGRYSVFSFLFPFSFFPGKTPFLSRQG